jgi:hypothetical protein
MPKPFRLLNDWKAEADFPQNITFAQSNLMKSYYEQKIIPTLFLMPIKFWLIQSR